MEHRIGTVLIQDDQGNALIERTLADEFGFRGNPFSSCFFSFRPNNPEDVAVCLQKTLEWIREKKSLTLVFGAIEPFTGCTIAEFGYNTKADCIKVLAEKM